MTNEQLAAAVQAGEADRLAELWAQVERFVAQQANRRFASLRGVEFDDLYNTGFLAVHAAAQTYDPARGMSFIGWLELALRTAFAEAGGYRSRKQGKDPLHRAGSLDAPISEDDDTTLGELQADPSAAASLEAAERRIWCAQLRGVLDRALEAEIMGQDGVKTCEVCGKPFRAVSNRAKYCEECSRKVRRKKDAERKRGKRWENVRI